VKTAAAKKMDKHADVVSLRPQTAGFKRPPPLQPVNKSPVHSPQSAASLPSSNKYYNSDEDVYSDKSLMGLACDVWWECRLRNEELTPPYISMHNWYYRLGYAREILDSRERLTPPLASDHSDAEVKLEDENMSEVE